MPLLDKLDQCVIDIVRMRSIEEVLPILDGKDLRIRTIGEEFDFLLRIGNGIHRILCTLVPLLEEPVAFSLWQATHMEPQDWAVDIKQSAMQTISFL